MKNIIRQETQQCEQLLHKLLSMIASFTGIMWFITILNTPGLQTLKNGPMTCTPFGRSP